MKEKKKPYLGRIPIPRPGASHKDKSKIIPRKKKHRERLKRREDS